MENRSVFIFVVLFSLSLTATFSAAKAPQLCKVTANCADSGTICKTTTGAADSENPDDFTVDVQSDSVEPVESNDEFDPLTSDDTDLLNDQSDFSDDAVAGVNPDAAVADPTDDPNVVTLRPGVKVAQAKEDVQGDDTIKIGSEMVVNGWKCTVTAIKPSDKDSNTKGKGVSADALSAFDGSFVPADNDDSDDAANDAVSDDSSKLFVGKIVVLGPITCKVTGQAKKSTGTTVKPTGPTTTRSTARPTTKTPDQSTSARTTRLTTAKPKPVPGPVKGRCVCDENKRFACTTDDDCKSRFRESNIWCFPTSICSKQLGIGYCRKTNTAVLDDIGSGR